jgi:hypothetical protein
VVVVLRHPGKWFGERGTLAFGSSLSSLLERLRWRALTARLPHVMLVSLLDATPPKQWDNLQLFDEVLFLDDLLQTSRKVGAVGNDLLLRGSGLTMDDIRGLQMAKDWLNSALQMATGEASVWTADECRSRVPYCVALCAPSGAGKTMFLAALAGCPQLSVLPLLASSIINAGVGDTPAAVRRHFAHAEQLRPACVVLDDADVLSKKSIRVFLEDC